MTLPAWLLVGGIAGPVVVGPGASGPVHEGVPAALHVVLGGTVLDQCGDNGALRCTRLVEQTTQFPVYGTAQEQAAIVQALEDFYADFDLVITTKPPIEFVPHLLAVIGGTSSLIGQEQTSCGIATISCGAEYRSSVSLTFAMSCGGPDSTLRVAEIAAQESAHNLGLEHTSSWNDIMFPTVNDDDKSFEDVCNEILTANYDDAYLCPEVHQLDCPAGAGGQQNSYAELMRVLGPRSPDSEAPKIIETVPADGATVSGEGTMQVFGFVSDDSPTVGVRWTWLEGPGLDDAEIRTRCTNGVCDATYESWKEIDAPWPFIEIEDPQPGTYSFRLEVADTYGNETSQTVRVEVEESTTETGDGTQGTGDDAGAGTLGSTGDTGANDDGGESGCRCGAAPGATAWSVWAVAVLVRRRNPFRSRGMEGGAMLRTWGIRGYQVRFGCQSHVPSPSPRAGLVTPRADSPAATPSAATTPTRP